MYSIQDLAVFVAVADGGSIRQAASDLARTQPAITQSIHRLEEAVGFLLLDRSGYRVTLTEHGALFLKRARVSVKQAKELKYFAGLLLAGNESHVRLSIHGSLCPQDWIHLIAHFPEEFPNTILEFHVAEDGAPLRQLMSGDVDLAIAAGPSTDKHVVEINRKRLGEIEYVFVIKKDLLTGDLEADLQKYPQILVTDFDSHASNYGIGEGSPYWCVNDHKTKVSLISAGLGWGAVPKWMIQDFENKNLLSAFQYRGVRANPTHTFYLCHRHQSSLGPAAATIWNRCDRAGESDESAS